LAEILSDKAIRDRRFARLIAKSGKQPEETTDAVLSPETLEAIPNALDCRLLNGPDVLEPVFDVFKPCANEQVWTQGFPWSPPTAPSIPASIRELSKIFQPPLPSVISMNEYVHRNRISTRHHSARGAVGIGDGRDRGCRHRRRHQ
jgi:hypothetical protein